MAADGAGGGFAVRALVVRLNGTRFSASVSQPVYPFGVRSRHTGRQGLAPSVTLDKKGPVARDAAERS